MTARGTGKTQSECKSVAFCPQQETRILSFFTHVNSSSISVMAFSWTGFDSKITSEWKHFKRQPISLTDDALTIMKNLIISSFSLSVFVSWMLSWFLVSWWMVLISLDFQNIDGYIIWSVVFVNNHLHAANGFYNHPQLYFLVQSFCESGCTLFFKRWMSHFETIHLFGSGEQIAAGQTQAVIYTGQPSLA